MTKKETLEFLSTKLTLPEFLAVEAAVRHRAAVRYNRLSDAVEIAATARTVPISNELESAGFRRWQSIHRPKCPVRHFWLLYVS